jgi:hypothetical protein
LEIFNEELDVLQLVIALLIDQLVWLFQRDMYSVKLHVAVRDIDFTFL